MTVERSQNLKKISHLFLKLRSNVKTKWRFFSNSCGLLKISELYVPDLHTKSNAKIKALKTDVSITSIHSWEGHKIWNYQVRFFFKFLCPSQNIWTLPARPSRAKAMQKSRLWRLKFQLPQWILVHSWSSGRLTAKRLQKGLGDQCLAHNWLNGVGL